MSDANDAYNVTADELRQFIERFEQLESEKKDVTEQQKELMAEAKGRGYALQRSGVEVGHAGEVIARPGKPEHAVA